MWKADEIYKETKHGDVGDKHSIRTVILSAGTAFLMAACLKRAVVLFLVEQWLVWVFLVLNLVVVAIFFSSNLSREPEKIEKVEIKERKMDEVEEEEDEEENKEEEEDVRLSKEELNERVEAFIVMFKQHLISDAKRGGNSHTRLTSDAP